MDKIDELLKVDEKLEKKLGDIENYWEENILFIDIQKYAKGICVKDLCRKVMNIKDAIKSIEIRFLVSDLERDFSNSLEKILFDMYGYTGNIVIAMFLKKET